MVQISLNSLALARSNVVLKGALIADFGISTLEFGYKTLTIGWVHSIWSENCSFWSDPVGNSSEKKFWCFVRTWKKVGRKTFDKIKSRTKHYALHWIRHPSKPRVRRSELSIRSPAWNRSIFNFLVSRHFVVVFWSSNIRFEHRIPTTGVLLFVANETNESCVANSKK